MPETKVNPPPVTPEQARSNRRLALVHLALALGILFAFVWFTWASGGR